MLCFDDGHNHHQTEHDLQQPGNGKSIAYWTGQCEQSWLGACLMDHRKPIRLKCGPNCWGFAGCPMLLLQIKRCVSCVKEHCRQALLKAAEIFRV